MTEIAAVKNHDPSSDTRLAWLDALKGFGIALVVMGHNQMLPWDGVGNTIIYSFHIPLFFALGGASIRGLVFDKLIERCLSVLWVYFLIGSLILVIATAAPRDGAALASEWPAWHAFLGLVYGSGDTIRNGPMWFLPCFALSLFVASCVLILIQRSTFLANGSWLILALALIFIFAGERLMSPVPLHTTVWKLDWGSIERSGYFWNANFVVMATGFLLYGHWLGKKIASVTKHQSIALSILMIALYCGLYPALDGTSWLVCAKGTWGPRWIASSAALAAITALFLLARNLGDILSLKNLGRIGQATLPILIIHGVIQRKASGLLENMMSDWAVIAIGVMAGVCVPVLIDSLLKKTIVWQLLFYPRKFIYRVSQHAHGKMDSAQQGRVNALIP